MPSQGNNVYPCQLPVKIILQERTLEEAANSSDGVVEEPDFQVLFILGKEINDFPLYAGRWHVRLPGLDSTVSVGGRAEVRTALSAQVVSQSMPQNVT